MELGRGDRLPHPRGSQRGADRVRPDLVVLHDASARRRAVGCRDGASVGYLLRKHATRRGCSRRMLVRPVGGIAHALATASICRAPATTSRRCAVGSAATSARAARRAPRDGRATARARSARPLASERRPSTPGGRRARCATASASASALGGSSRSKPSGWATPTPAVVPDELRRAAARGIARPEARSPSPRGRRRTRIVHLRVQQQVRTSEDRPAHACCA